MEKHYFEGICKWAKIHVPDEKYGKYSIDVLLSDQNYLRYRGLNLKGTGKRDEDGDGFWVSFRRDPSAKVYRNGEEDKAGTVKVVDVDGNPMTDLIGNGSLVMVKIVTYPYDNKFGIGTGSRLVAVKVLNLVKYTKGGADHESPDEPF